MFCKECGTQLSDDAQFCPNCGKEVVSSLSAKNTASSPPKKRTAIIIGLIGVLILGVAVGIFVITKNQTNKSSDIETTVQEPTQHEDISNETVLNTGTYVNELDRITIAKDVSGQYTFNLTGYDESGDFLLLSGSIDNNNGNYVGSISDDESGSFIDKKFSIMPTDNSIIISSDDDSLLFLCVEYQYMSEVDALEDNTNGYDADNMVSPNVTGDTLLKEGYYGYTSNDIEYMLFIYSDHTFIINVTKKSTPILYGEGELYSNGNDMYKADITICDDDFMRNQTIDISVIDENTLSVSAQYVQLNNVIQGTYQFGGSSSDSEEYSAEIYGNIPYVAVTANVIGMEYETYLMNTPDRIDLPTDYLNARFSRVLPLIRTDDTTYYGYYDKIIGLMDSDIYIIGVDEGGYITSYSAAPNRNRYDSSLLYEIGVNDIEPYIVGNVGDKQEQLLIWRLDNAYLVMAVALTYSNGGLVPVSMTSVTISQDINGDWLGIE